MDNIIKSLSDFISPSGAKSLAELQALPFGYAKVKDALNQVYAQLGYESEGLFPCFRVRIDQNMVHILNLAPALDVSKILMNFPYIQDRYQKQVLHIGSRVQSKKSTLIAQVADGFEKISVPIEYQIISYKLIQNLELTDKIITSLMNQETKLLTYELVKQLHFQLQLPPEKFDLSANMNKIYQPLLYTWLNHLHMQQLKGAA